MPSDFLAPQISFQEICAQLRPLFNPGKTVKRLVAWLWRAWPILLITATIILHLLVLKFSSFERTFINKLAGTVMQIAGGLIVLQSIDGNLGIFRKQNLLAVVIGWFRDFPFIHRSISIQASSVASVSAFGEATFTVKRAVSTLEERLLELERQTEKLRVEVRAESAAIRQRVDEVRNELLASVNVNQVELRQLTEKIERATVGGFKQQSFGVLLAIYGALVSVFA